MGIIEAISRQKRAFGLILILFIIGLFIVPRLVMVFQDMSKRTILYQTPSDGEDIEIGEWMHGAIIIEPPPEGLMNFIAISVDVIVWNDCTYTLDMNYGIVTITPSQYLELNSTEKDIMFGNGFRYISQNKSYTGESQTSISSTGTHVWALKFVGTYVDVPAMTIRVFFTISIIHDTAPIY